MRVPIACTLSADSAVDRIEEWRRFLLASAAVVRTGADDLRIRLASAESLLGAADLARREKACCAFFDFSIEIEADALWLRVQVPPGSAGALDDLASLRPQPR